MYDRRTKTDNTPDNIQTDSELERDRISRNSISLFGFHKGNEMKLIGRIREKYPREWYLKI
jgi:hypothetical protein